MTHPHIAQQITFLYTQDLEKSAFFYEQIMGFSMVLDQGTCRIYRTTTDGFLGFCQREGVLPPKDDVIFTLVSPDVDAWYEYLCAKGVEFEKPPQENHQYKIYHCFLRDPNGYLIEIQRFLDPRWPE